MREKKIDSIQSLPENRKGTLPNSFYEASITMIAKTNMLQKIKLQTTIPLYVFEHKCRNPQQNICKSDPAMYEKTNTAWHKGVYARTASMVQYLSIN